MFIKKLCIKNYRLFDSNDYEIDDFNIPDKINEGTGLTVFVGEKGCGKTTILDAISSTILDYKADSFNISDINNPNEKTEIKIFSDKDFNVLGTFPNTNFDAKGFLFTAGLRGKGSKSYLVTPVVHDQQFIKSNPDKPKDGSPDLRLSVNNPFSGKRFNDTDILYLDKNRLFQTRSGTYNNTRFDRIMDDFNFQYNKNSESIVDLNQGLNEIVKKGKIQNKYLETAIDKFESISGYRVQLDFLNNYAPFKNASFVIKKDSNQQVSLSSLGSGYEMMFSLVYSYYMSEQNQKNMIILIDEPELHLHPKIQQKFVEFLLQISKTAQVIITTHSALLIKQLSYNDFVKTIILKNDTSFSKIEDRKLSYISSNETNYLAFNLATEEYHNELYEELFYQHATSSKIKDFDNQFFINTKGESKSYPWLKYPNEVSLHTFIRNQIHHRADNGQASYSDLETSIKIMRTYL